MAEQHPWSASRGMAQAFVVAYAHTGVSGAAVLEALQSVGLGYREGSFYEDWRRETGLAKGEYESRRLTGGTVPPDRLMADTPWPGMSSKYLYTVEYSAYNRTSGDYEIAYAAVGSERSLTVGEILTGVEDAIDEGASAEGLDVADLSYIGGRSRSW